MNSHLCSNLLQPYITGRMKAFSDARRNKADRQQGEQAVRLLRTRWAAREVGPHPQVVVTGIAGQSLDVAFLHEALVWSHDGPPTIRACPRHPDHDGGRTRSGIGLLDGRARTQPRLGR